MLKKIVCAILVMVVANSSFSQTAKAPLPAEGSSGNMKWKILEQVSPQMLSLAPANHELKCVSISMELKGVDLEEKSKLEAPPLEGLQTGNFNIIMQEDFEGTFPTGLWQIFDGNGATNGEYYWGVTNYKYKSPTHSAWCAKNGANALNPPANYPNYCNSWMVYGPFELSETKLAFLDFHFWLDTEPGYDGFSWLASTNGTDFYGYGVSGNNGNAWIRSSFNLKDVPSLGDITGQSSVWIAFVFTSDGSVTDRGVFLDDISITAGNESIAVINRNTIHEIIWADKPGLSGETYNVYMSEYPITDVNSANVYLIGSEILENAGLYEYQLYTPATTGAVTYYYAVTAVSNGVENTTIIAGENATTVGEAGTTTWGLAMVWVDGTVFSPPVPDGSMSDWMPYYVYLDPLSPDNKIVNGEIDDADDCSGNLYIAANDDAFYFGADVNDDYLEHTYEASNGSMWKGDVVEYYLGIYDMRPSDARHDDHYTAPEPDFQVDIKCNAGTDPSVHVFTGGKAGDTGLTATEQWCNSRIPGDLTSGRYVEVKLPYPELEWDPLNQPVPRPKIGWVLPCNTMISDTDTPGSADREGQLSWSNDENAGSSWTLPDVWKHQVVIYDPKQLSSPGTQATNISVTDNNTVHTIHWTNAAGITGETYNVYKSESPITNVAAACLIGTDIAEGMGSYEYQLFTPEGEGGDDVTNYYAVTAVLNGIENTLITSGGNATIAGAAGTTTWGLAMVWVDGTIYDPPVPDCDMSDWAPYFIYLDPESPYNRIVNGQFDDADDCSGNMYIFADEDAFYFGADINDDYLEHTYAANDPSMWQGDVVEYYFGVYDMRPSDSRHEDQETASMRGQPDFQVDIKCNAGTDPCICIYTGGAVPTQGFPTATEQCCGPRIHGDLTSGRYVEVKLPYWELEWDPLNQPIPRPKIGWVLPCNMMIGDTDTPGGINREAQLSWSNDEAAGSSWTRPDVWMHQVIIYDPKCLGPVEFQATNISVTNNDRIHIIHWTDATVAGGTYNVYMSTSPITSVAAANLIGTDIAEGTGMYEYQLYTPYAPGGDAVTNYYAVTVVSDGIENTAITSGENATADGEDGTTTYGLAMIWYDGTLHDPPVPDGDMSDWAKFNNYLDPTSPDNKVVNGEFDDADDCSGYLYVGADDEALYLGADVDDDWLEHNYPVTEGGMWQGDVVEYYIGIYDRRPSDPVHDDGMASPEPDFQFDIKSNAGTDACVIIYTGGSVPTLGHPTATTQWCNSRVEGDLTSGRISEVKLPYTECEWDPLVQPIPRPQIGWVLPCNMMISDTDTPGSTAREGQVSWSNDDAAGSSWNFPSVWKHQVVVYDPGQLKPLSGPVVRIDPAFAEIYTGNTGTLDVVVDKVNNLGAFEFTIRYNAQLVRILSSGDVTLGSFLGSTGRSVVPVGPSIDNTTGEVTFGAASLGTQAGPSIESGGVLASISWTAQQNSGITDLTLANIQLTHPDGSTIPDVSCVNGRINITTCYWADIDCDGDVDIVDIQIVAGKWNTHTGDPNYDPRCDIDHDGDIDIVDIQRVASQWGWPNLSGGNMAKAETADDSQNLILRIRSSGAAAAEISVENGFNLGAFQFDVVPGNDRIKVNTIESGKFLTQGSNTVITLGPQPRAAGNGVTFGACSFGKKADANDSGVLARIKFNGDGPFTLDLENVQLTDAHGRLITAIEIVNEMTVSAIPKAFSLHQNYPNPFNPTTTIRFDIPNCGEKSVKVKLCIYNLQGRLVRTLMDGEKGAGSHLVQWNGENNRGEKVSSGIYLYTLKAGSFKAVKKMLIIK